MAFASRNLKLNVNVTDINPNALSRMKNIIYPKRYGAWDSKISLLNYNDLKYLKKNFDLIIIGTPPKNHLDLFNFCLKTIKFKNILIEKPLSVYSQKNITKLKNLDNLYCGYNHSISKSVNYFLSQILKFKKNINYIDVNWKEGWSGILNAHFWMKNEFQSYLGNIEEGGGSLHEHSHGLHLLLVIFEVLKINLKSLSQSQNIFFRYKGEKKYDEFTQIFFTNKKIFAKYETDLKTYPAKKEISVSGKNFCLKWICNHNNNSDKVIVNNNGKIKEKIFYKTRSSEFENEINHILFYNKKSKKNLNINFAIETMKIINKTMKHEK